MTDAPNQSSSAPTNGHNRGGGQAPEDTAMFALNDDNSWYYPSHGHDSDEENPSVYREYGNWGKKMSKGARWVHRGKMTAWGPEMEDWEAEERARKRLELLLPQERRSPSPPSLPHLRSPSPPLTSPYPPPISQHLSYLSFVMDKAVTHTFRSSLLDELEAATNGLIAGEYTMRRALGRLWLAISDGQDHQENETAVIPKLEDHDGDGGEDMRERRIARAPDLTPPSHKHFLSSYSNTGQPVFDSSSHLVSPALQLENLEKGLATLRELQDDGREYIERLYEIREGLGEIRAQRSAVWELVREKSVKELVDAAYETAV